MHTGASDTPRTAPSTTAALPALLHCVWTGNGFLLWAETDRPVHGAADGHPDAAWRAAISTHPNALDYDALWTRLMAARLLPESGNASPRTGTGMADAPARPTRAPAPASAQPRIDALRPASATLNLPTSRGTPLHSPGAGGGAESRGRLAQWHLTGLALPVAQADPWLHPFRLETAAGTPDAPLALAHEWAFWWRAAAFVRAMIGRAAFAPTLAWYHSTPRALPTWRPVYGSADEQTWAALCRAVPPASLVPGTAAEHAIAAFVWEYGEGLIRSALRRHKPLAAFRKTDRGETDPVRLWLASLLAAGPKRLPPNVGTRGRIAEWMADPAGVSGPPLLVLQLSEPAPDAPDRWPLALFLERASDPGVLRTPGQIAAEAQGPIGESTASRADRDLQHFAEAMERAAALIPALVPDHRPVPDPRHAPDGPKVPAATAPVPPDRIHLTPDEALRLLLTPEHRLRAAGLRLLVPSWWKPPRLGTRLRLRASAGRGLFAADALVRYDWRVSLGDQSVSAEEFERLVALRTPFVRLNGQWVALPPEAAAEVVRRWKANGPQGELGPGPALLLALQAAADQTTATATPSAATTTADPASDARPDTDPTLDVDADETILQTLHDLAAGGGQTPRDGARAAPESLPEPPGFQGTLRPYQRRGLAWLAARADLGLGGVLADDMGLGKTIQVLALLAHRHAAGTAHGPTLIVAPTSVVANWADEAARFAPGLNVVTHQGADRARGGDLAATIVAAQIVLTSYPLLLRDADSLAGVPWDGVILDEAQNVKNASAKQAQAARRMRAHYRFALTGTPVENALSDLWSIFAFVQPGYLGSAETFRRRLAAPIERAAGAAADAPPDPQAERARETLRRLIGPLVLRRTKAERGVADELPPRIETVERCVLTPEQAALYQAVTRELLARVEEASGMRRKAAVLLALLRLKQVCNHPAHYAGDGSRLEDRSGKLARLVELLAEVAAEGERALVFTQFAAWARRLAGHLAEHLGPRVPVLCLDGSTPAAERADLVARFQDARGPAVFVLSIRAGGAGLNLTAARHVFHYDRWWNPAVERQATDRAHRIGQTGTVQVHKLIATGTLEDRIDRLIREKEALADGVLQAAAASGHGESWLTELDDAALRDLLTLRRTALS